MKKFLFLSIAATAMLASCSNEEVVEMNPQSAINFESFVDKATRAELTTDNLQTFSVYGLDASLGTTGEYIFDCVKVSKGDNNPDLTSNTGWYYEDTRYWVKGHNYFFEAVAPAKDASDAHWNIETKSGKSASSTIRFDNTSSGANGETDLIYATATKSNVDLANPGTVDFTFSHLLSRVKFTFENGMNSDAVKLRVYDITIKGTWGAALINKSDETPVWHDPSGTVDLVCSEITSIENAKTASSGVKYMIPRETEGVTYEISFKVDLIQDNVTTATYTHSVQPGTTIPLLLPEVKMQEGYSYNFTACLTPENITGDENTELKPIEFTVTVNTFKEVEGGEIESFEKPAASN